MRSAILQYYCHIDNLRVDICRLSHQCGHKKMFGNNQIVMVERLG